MLVATKGLAPKVPAGWFRLLFGAKIHPLHAGAVPCNTPPHHLRAGVARDSSPRPALRFYGLTTSCAEGRWGCKMPSGDRGASPPIGTAPHHRLRAGASPETRYATPARTSLPRPRLREPIIGSASPGTWFGVLTHILMCVTSRELVPSPTARASRYSTGL